MICPNCKEPVEEGAAQCPHCQKSLIQTEYNWKHRVLAVLGIIGVIVVNILILVYIGTRG